MKLIAVTVIQGDEGPILTPAEPLPETAVRINCDGETYTVYEAGDTLPAP